MNGFERFKSVGILFGVAFILIGVIFLVFPEKIIISLAFIVGAVIIVYGIFKGAMLALQWQASSNKYFKLILSLLSIALGIFIITNTRITITALGIIMGVFAIMLAFDRFNMAFLRKKANLSNKWTWLTGFVHLAFGIGMFYSAFSLISIIISIIGIYLLMAGIMIALSTSYFFDF